MAKSLVIVESPAKAKTIGKYLGKEFQVEASVGHIMDLPKKELGVELEHLTFEPTLVVSPGKEKVVERLKKLAGKAEMVYLAPDPDREGEAIAAHLAFQLKPVMKDKKNIQRVTFNEITKKAVQEAFLHARDIDEHLVDAQQTRRVLDRIVGYQISPLLWDKVRRGLSAGRVQTVALRLIVEREAEIRAFNPVEYWTIGAMLTPSPDGKEFTARFLGIDGEKAVVESVDTASVPDEKQARAIEQALQNAKWSVRQVERKEKRRYAPAPFTTSKLQQDASRQLGFNVRRTMGVAQRLYEGIELGPDGTVGLITYMRTDSTRVSPDAITGAREFIGKSLGKEYLPAEPNIFKSKKDAQDAHEAIRPSDVAFEPENIKQYLSDEQYRLYKLIWQRFVASQIVPAVFDQTSVDIVAKADKNYDFRVTGSVLKFDGFLKVYEESKDAKDEDDEALKNQLPELNDGDALVLKGVLPEQHFTEPPPRFNEASLVKTLEERGIGRPSTYATIINTIQEREYVQKSGGRNGRFVPTEIGQVVTGLLVKNFEYIFDPQYTAKLEEELDEVEEGKEKWTDLLKGFYGYFKKELKNAEKHMENVKRMEVPTNEKCEVCGSPLVLKWGKFGTFFACSAYDKKKKDSCTFTKENFAAKPDLQTPEGEQQEEYCENCGRVMVLRNGPWGPFMACPGYNEDPPCKTVRRLNQKQQQKPPVPLDEKCPKCGEQLVLRNGQYGEFVSCSGYPKCKYIKQNLIGVHCPLCADGEIVEKKARRGNYFYGCSEYPKCKFTSNYKPVDQKCPECGSPYLMEKTLKSGVYLICPNNKKPSGDEKPARRGKRVAEETAPAVECSFTERIGDAPVVEEKAEKDDEHAVAVS
jgi:DNA topoisomerase-1